ncbi:MAG: hypothetical protein ACP5QK_00650 [Myxococcota bacterium]
MKKLTHFVFLSLFAISYFGCSDPCRDAADKVKDCLEKFCEKYGQTTDQAKMKCSTFYTICPNGENPACGFDFDRCSKDNSLADPVLDGRCDETTGEVKK